MTDKPTTLIVCVNRRFQSDKGSCAEKGSGALADILEQSIRERNIDITLERIKCLGVCGNGPSMGLATGGNFSSRSIMMILRAFWLSWRSSVANEVIK